MDDVNGPYDTEQQAAAEPMPRAAAAAGRDRRARDIILHALLDACEDSELRLGAFDLRILAWLSDREPTTAQVVIGLIRRAYESGRSA